jgi:hypothetical protein
MADTPDTPDTFLSTINGQDAIQDKTFDPALLHFSRAFRLGAPSTQLTNAKRQEWFSLQEKFTNIVLQGLVASPLGASLVLRGSWLLRMWFGLEARVPNDLDFVALDGQTPESTVATIEEILRTNDACVAAPFIVDSIRVSDIWTYERALGRRVVIPWATDDLNGLNGVNGVNGLNGAVQIDVTFNEEVPGVVERFSNESDLFVVNQEVSLAWKLKWLLSDMHPQGKDLFDAVLLSRNVHLSADTETWLRNSFIDEFRLPSGEVQTFPAYSGELDDFSVVASEWQWFAREYPELAQGHSVDSLMQALSHNLREGK